MARRTASRPAKGTPTALNIWVMADMLRKHAGKIPLRVESSHFDHLKRCLAAGYLEFSADKQTIVATGAGRAAIKASGA